MSSPSQHPLGQAVPPAPRHAITVHLPFWSTLIRFLDGDKEVVGSLKSTYPRFLFHQDVQKISDEVWRAAGSPADRACFLFSSVSSATECKEFAASKARGDNRVEPSEVAIRTFWCGSRLHAVFLPESKKSVGQQFWTITGTGISSRLAEHCLQSLESIREVFAEAQLCANAEVSAHTVLRQRIAHALKRDIVGPLPNKTVLPEDVYLYPTGMTVIHATLRCLNQLRDGISAVFGVPFHSTTDLFETIGSGFEIFNNEAESMEQLLSRVRDSHKGPKVQAIWAEVPSNPLLTTPDLIRIREIADQYGIPLIIDDTIGSFCNVDLLAVADVLVTSTTKSFSGYADVMGGSLVLNPAGPHYERLKTILASRYVNDYWSGDAITLEKNSRDYMLRSKILNSNAQRLVDHLQTYVKDESCKLSHVYYTTTMSSGRQHYERFMRPKTEEFTPGYGCLFSMEFDSVDTTIAFYDNLAMYKSPHLGAHVTLALPYVRGVYAKHLDWAAKHGLRETQIRISVGLEDFEDLRDRFDMALKANAIKTGDSQ